MTRITAVRHLEDCLDNSVVKEVELTAPVDQALMYVMARAAALDYHPEFPRPYYRITRQSQYVIQGVLGNRTFRVTLSPSRPPNAERELLQLIESGAEGETLDGKRGSETRGLK